MNRLKHWMFEAKKKRCKHCCLVCKYYKDCVAEETLKKLLVWKLDRLNKRLWKMERKHEKLDREYRKLVDSM